MSYRYDVALSFAGENRPYVEQVAEDLRSRGVKVFYDLYEQATLWGKNLYNHLRDVYQHQARFTIIFISREYASKLWTSHERESAQARAFEENQEYILPARFDDADVPGILRTIAYVDLRETSPQHLRGAGRQRHRDDGLAPLEGVFGACRHDGYPHQQRETCRSATPRARDCHL
jgi:hypothetical protein